MVKIVALIEEATKGEKQATIIKLKKIDHIFVRTNFKVINKENQKYYNSLVKIIG